MVNISIDRDEHLNQWLIERLFDSLDGIDMITPEDVYNKKVEARRLMNQICIDNDFNPENTMDAKIVFHNEFGICYE